ncbi:hypothetical protein HA402_005768 [Bradysia odoriphaga]|nr:hypothetical protein HA402_005768 [Bradysia odoriphaga]
MDSHFQSRIPLSITKRQNTANSLQRCVKAPICLNERYCDSLANTRHCGAVPRNQCSNIAGTKKLPAHISAATKKPPAYIPAAMKKPPVLTWKRPLLDDYLGRYKILLEKFESLNQQWTLTKSELERCKGTNEILTGKLVAAENELKSVRQDLKRLKVTNKANEQTIAVLQRKIDGLKIRTDVNEEFHSTRSGRCVRAPEKYQANSC